MKNLTKLKGALFEGAVDERKNCDDEVLVDRINWIKAFIADVWSKTNH